MSEPKLSEAIRQGAKLRPQISGRFFSRKGSCAIGAGFEGLLPKAQRRKTPSVYMKKYSIQPMLCSVFPELTEYSANPVSLLLNHRWGIITDLNDKQHWTREQIADWLQKQGY